MLKTINLAGERVALACLIATISYGSAVAGEHFAPCGDSALMSLAGSLCATSQVPLQPEDPEAGVIELFIRKFPSTNGTTTGQAWLVAGGP